MAEQSKRAGYSLEQALKKVAAGDDWADRRKDTVRLQQSELLGRNIIAKRAGEATLQELVFVVHGIDWYRDPRNEAENELLQTYRHLQTLCDSNAGEPMAAVGARYSRYGEKPGLWAPYWIGRTIAPKYTLVKSNYGYQGTVSMLLEDKHEAVWREPRVPHPELQPTFDMSDVQIWRQPGATEDIAKAISTDTFPGRLSVFDGESAGQSLVFGWNDILLSSGVLRAGDEASQRFLGRASEVMANLGHTEE